MIIYVHSKYREIQYESNIMPRKNEILNFPHFGNKSSRMANRGRS